MQQHHRKQSCVEPRRKIKRRKDEHVLSNIVSLRISDQEKQFIEKVTRDSSRSVSDVVREAIECWIASHKQLFSNNQPCKGETA